MMQPLNFSLNVHQIDALNFEMCKIVFRGNMPPDPPQNMSVSYRHYGLF